MDDPASLALANEKLHQQPQQQIAIHRAADIAAAAAAGGGSNAVLTDVALRNLPVHITSPGQGAGGSDGDGDDDDVYVTRMDLVKRTLNFLVDWLRDEDAIAVCGFSNAARTILPWSLVGHGREKIKERIASLEPDEKTNLYDGISCGFDMLDEIVEGFER